MSGLEDWEPVPASNNAAPPVGAPVNHDRSDVNDIAREMMASQRADWEGTATGGGEWRNLIKGETLNYVSGTVVDVVGVDVTAFFPAGRKIRVLHSSGSDAYCFVVSSSFTTNTRITVEDFDTAGASVIGAAVNGLQIHCTFGGAFGIKSGAFETAGGALFVVPTALTAAGINAAIATAVSSGKIVLLADDEYVLEAAVVLDSNVEIWGRGMSGDTVLKVAYDGYGITITNENNITLRDFTLNGDYSTRSAGGGIKITGTSHMVVLERIKVTNAWEHCIHAVGSGSTDENDLMVRNCVFDTFGDKGLYVQDPNNSTGRNHYSGLSIIDIGGVGKNSASATGLHVAGEATISDIDIVMDSAFGRTQALGIVLEQATSSGVPPGSINTTLNGFRIVGSLASQTGLFVGGRNNIISNGYVEVTGAGAKPLVVDGRGGSPDQALDNHLSGVYFKDGDSCVVETDALRTEFHGCVFDSQSTAGLVISGTNTLVKNCRVNSSVPTGIRVSGGAQDVGIAGCTMRGMNGVGIDIQPGSDDCMVTGCTLRDIIGDGIQVDAGADRARILSTLFTTVVGDGVDVSSIDSVVTGCTFLGITGSAVNVKAGATRTLILGNSGFDVSDSGTDTVVRHNIPQVDELLVAGTDQPNFNTNEISVTGMDDVDYPGLGANGTRRFMIHAKVQVVISSNGPDTIQCRVREGTTFPVIVTYSQTDAALSNMIFEFKTITTPAVAEQVTVSVEASIQAANGITGDGTFLHIRYLDG